MLRRRYIGSSSPKRSKRVPFFVLLFLVCSLLFFRDRIACQLLSSALGLMASGKGSHVLSFSSKTSDHGRLQIKDFTFHKDSVDLSLDELNIYCHVSLIPFKITAYMHAPKASARVATGGEGAGSATALYLLFPHKIIKPSVQIDEGELFCGEGGVEPLLFSFTQQKEENCIGRLHVQSSGEKPLHGDVFLYHREEKLSIHLTGEIEDASVALPLIALSPAFKEIEKLEGQINIAADLVLARHKNLEHMLVKADAERFILKTPDSFLQLSSCGAHLEYLPSDTSIEKQTAFWKNMSGTLSISGAQMQGFGLKDLQIQNAEGALELSVGRDPKLDMSMDLVASHIKAPAQWNTTGAIHHDGSFWLDSQLTLLEENNDTALVSLSFCRVDDQSYVVSADMQGFATTSLSLIGASGLIPEDVSLRAKKMDGRLLASFEKGALSKVELDHMQLKGFVSQWQKEKASFSADSMSLSGSFYRTKQPWYIRDLQLKVDEATCHTERCHFTEGSISLQYQEGLLQPSSFTASFNTGSVRATAEGPLEDIQLYMSAEIPYGAFLSLFVKDHLPSFSKDKALVLDMHASYKDHKISAAAEGHIDSSDISLSFQVPMKEGSSWLARELIWSDAKAFLSSSKIGDFVYGPFVHNLLPQGDITGDVAIKASLERQKVSGTLISEDLFWQTEQIAASLGPIGSGAFTFCYDMQTLRYKADLILSDAFFAEGASGACLNKIQGRILFEDHKIKGENLSALVEGMTLPFSLYYDVEGLFITTHKTQGRLENLCSLSYVKKRLLTLADKIKGEFSLPEAGCQLFVRKGLIGWSLHYKIGAALTDVQLSLDDHALLHTSLDVSFDSSTSKVALKNSSSHLDWHGRQYDITLADLIFDPRNPTPFSLDVLHREESVLSLRGTLALTHQWVFSFDSQKTTLLTMPLTIEKMVFDLNLALQEMKISMTITDRARRALCLQLPLADLWTGAVGQTLQEECSSLKGDMTAELAFHEGKGALLSMSSDRLLLDDLELRGCLLKGRYHNEMWVIDSLQFNGYDISLTLDTRQNEIKIPSIRFKGASAHADGSASIDLATRRLSLDASSFSFPSEIFEAIDKRFSSLVCGSFKGDIIFSDAFSVESVKGKVYVTARMNAPLTYELAMEKEASVFYNHSSGLIIESPSIKGVDVTGKKMLMTLALQRLSYEPKSHHLQISNLSAQTSEMGARFAISLFPNLGDIINMKKDGCWKVKGDVNIFEKALDARLKLSSGAYIAAGKEYSLIDPLVQISEASVHVHSQLKGAKASLYIDVQKDYVSDVPLYLLLRENLEAEGMKILCRAKGSDFEPVRFEGKIMGIEASLQKSQHIKDGSFFGSVKISFTDAAKILPEALNDIATALKLGKGIKAQGHFFLPLSDDEPFSFRGDLIGEQCDLIGYTLDHLQIKASISPEKVLLEDIKIDDIAGSVSIKTCQIEKEEATGRWNLIMPLGHIKELRPSLLKEEGKRGGEKPFILKNLSVYDLSGIIGDKKSFTANGALQFSNSAKKEFSLLDIPFEMIKDLGLDLGILSPIAGEADFSLKKGRCVFHELKNSYSEGRRSQFFLASDSMAYIDLDGNWNVDLKMKQHVLLKWSESLLLSIRGTLGKPKYSLKNVDAP